MVKTAQPTVPSNKVRGRGDKPAPVLDGENREKANTVSYADHMQKAYSKRVDSVDKKLGLNFSLTKQPQLSTGLLSLDLTLGKGLVPGMSVYFGPEASAKSTACVTILKSSLLQLLKNSFNKKNRI